MRSGLCSINNSDVLVLVLLPYWFYFYPFVQSLAPVCMCVCASVCVSEYSYLRACVLACVVYVCVRVYVCAYLLSRSSVLTSPSMNCYPRVPEWHVCVRFVRKTRVWVSVWGTTSY